MISEEKLAQLQKENEAAIKRFHLKTKLNPKMKGTKKMNNIVRVVNGIKDEKIYGNKKVCKYLTTKKNPDTLMQPQYTSMEQEIIKQRIKEFKAEVEESKKMLNFTNINIVKGPNLEPQIKEYKKFQKQREKYVDLIELANIDHEDKNQFSKTQNAFNMQKNSQEKDGFLGEYVGQDLKKQKTMSKQQSVLERIQQQERIKKKEEEIKLKKEIELQKRQLKMQKLETKKQQMHLELMEYEKNEQKRREQFQKQKRESQIFLTEQRSGTPSPVHNSNTNRDFQLQQQQVEIYHQDQEIQEEQEEQEEQQQYYKQQIQNKIKDQQIQEGRKTSYPKKKKDDKEIKLKFNKLYQQFQDFETLQNTSERNKMNSGQSSKRNSDSDLSEISSEDEEYDEFSQGRISQINEENQDEENESLDGPKINLGDHHHQSSFREGSHQSQRSSQPEITPSQQQQYASPYHRNRNNNNKNYNYNNSKKLSHTSSRQTNNVAGSPAKRNSDKKELPWGRKFSIKDDLALMKSKKTDQILRKVSEDQLENFYLNKEFNELTGQEYKNKKSKKLPTEQQNNKTISRVEDQKMERDRQLLLKLQEQREVQKQIYLKKLEELQKQADEEEEKKKFEREINRLKQTQQLPSTVQTQQQTARSDLGLESPLKRNQSQVKKDTRQSMSTRIIKTNQVPIKFRGKRIYLGSQNQTFDEEEQKQILQLCKREKKMKETNRKLGLYSVKNKKQQAVNEQLERIEDEIFQIDQHMSENLYEDYKRPSQVDQLTFTNNLNFKEKYRLKTQSNGRRAGTANQPGQRSQNRTMFTTFQNLKTQNSINSLQNVQEDEERDQFEYTADNFFSQDLHLDNENIYQKKPSMGMVEYSQVIQDQSYEKMYSSKQSDRISTIKPVRIGSVTNIDMKASQGSIRGKKFTSPTYGDFRIKKPSIGFMSTSTNLVHSQQQFKSSQTLSKQQALGRASTVKLKKHYKYEEAGNKLQESEAKTKQQEFYTNQIKQNKSENQQQMIDLHNFVGILDDYQKEEQKKQAGLNSELNKQFSEINDNFDKNFSKLGTKKELDFNLFIKDAQKLKGY